MWNIYTMKYYSATEKNEIMPVCWSRGLNCPSLVGVRVCEWETMTRLPPAGEESPTLALSSIMWQSVPPIWTRTAFGPNRLLASTVDGGEEAPGPGSILPSGGGSRVAPEPAVEIPPMEGGSIAQFFGDPVEDFFRLQSLPWSGPLWVVCCPQGLWVSGEDLRGLNLGWGRDKCHIPQLWLRLVFILERDWRPRPWNGKGPRLAVPYREKTYSIAFGYRSVAPSQPVPETSCLPVRGWGVWMALVWTQTGPGRIQGQPLGPWGGGLRHGEMP